MMNKLEVLKQAHSARVDEVMTYQIDIDNYTRAVEKIAANYADEPGMAEFSANLKNLLESAKTEQLKAIIIRDVIADQIAELEPA
jgi:hypothetical protein|tara:strand:+ start:223 stop:477 length:255 start_codon:yes stop_codon:yes gene_type:complete